MKALLQKSVVFDVIDDSALKAVVGSANKLLASKRRVDSIWPSVKSLKDPERATLVPVLRLTSLDRIGTEQGTSGGNVWLGTFYPSKNLRGRVQSSYPLVVKFIKCRSAKSIHPLEDEYKRANAAQVYIESPATFALPLHLDRLTGTEEYEVLWSLFSSPTHFWGDDRLRYGDLLGALRRNDVKGAKDLIVAALDALTSMHNCAGGHCKQSTRTYGWEYRRYLRGMLNPRERWWRSWETQWGGASSKFTSDLGRKSLNPLWVASQILKSHQKFRLAVIHGDLHPRNIVESLGGYCGIIDFGWSEVDRHVAKDFVLLECNIRAVALHEGVGLADLDRLKDALQGNGRSTRVRGILSSRLTMIRELRKEAAKRLNCQVGDACWYGEYEVPLFLVALGLLRHIRSCDNQLALRHLVLSLADSVGARL